MPPATSSGECSAPPGLREDAEEVLAEDPRCLGARETARLEPLANVPDIREARDAPRVAPGRARIVPLVVAVIVEVLLVLVGEVEAEPDVLGANKRGDVGSVVEQVVERGVIAAREEGREGAKADHPAAAREQAQLLVAQVPRVVAERARVRVRRDTGPAETSIASRLARTPTCEMSTTMPS